MQIVRAMPEDAAALTAIAFAAKRHWGYPDRWIQQWSTLLTVGARYILDHDVYLATNGARAAGFYSLTPEHGAIRLEHLWVSPEQMGRGIGRALFGHAIERARTVGFDALQIESDPNAAGFYERMGARRVGARVVEINEQRRELPGFVYDLRLNG